MAGIEEAVCIQLAKFNDVEKSVSNARWSNHNKQPVTINQGDSISITKSFIDTRNLSSAGITILVDTPLELEMFFYWINDGNPGNLANGFNDPNDSSVWFIPLPASGGPSDDIENYTSIPDYSVQMTLQSVKNIAFVLPNDITGIPYLSLNMTINSNQSVPYADGRPYLLCYTDNKPFTQTWKYTLKAGTYSPDALATLLTTNMAEVKKQTAVALNKPNAVDWFDPYAPKVNLPKETTLDQPFQVNTNGSPPVWAIGETTSSKDSEGQYGTAVINCQPYIQIQQNNGLPANWFQGSSGFVSCEYNPVTPPTVPAVAGPPPLPSLCFKNIISDCPIPDTYYNLPNIPGSGGDAIPAAQCLVGLNYTILYANETNFIKMGAVSNTNGITFTCTAVEKIEPINPNIIPFTSMQTAYDYDIINAGLPFIYYITGRAPIPMTDTWWDKMGASDSLTYINNVYNIVQIQIEIAPYMTQTLQNIQTNITYVITSSSDLIDWSLYGGSPNTYTQLTDPIFPFIDGYMSAVAGTTYYVGTVGHALYPPYTNTYDTNWEVDGTFINVIGDPKLYWTCGVNGPSYISSGNTTNSDYIILGVWYKIITTDPLIDWTQVGGPSANNPDPDDEINIGSQFPSYPIIPPKKYIITYAGYNFTWGNSNPLNCDTNYDSIGIITQGYQQTNLLEANGNVYVPFSQNGTDLTFLQEGVKYYIISASGLFNWSYFGGPVPPITGVFPFATIVAGTLTGAFMIDSTSPGTHFIPPQECGFQLGSGYDTPYETLTAGGPTASPWVDIVTGVSNFNMICSIVNNGSAVYATGGTGNVPNTDALQVWFQIGVTYYVATYVSDTFLPYNITDFFISNGVQNPSPTTPFSFTVTTLSGLESISPGNTWTGHVVPTGSIVQVQYNYPFILTVNFEPNTPETYYNYNAEVIPSGIIAGLLPVSNIPWQATEYGNVIGNLYSGYNVDVIPTGTIYTITQPTFPMTFKATATGTDTTYNFPYTGNLLGTGTVKESDNFVDGIVYEVFNPNNPNFYIYPLKKTPAIPLEITSKYDSAILMNYTFPMVGSSEIQLSFNDQQNIFQWNYTHSPIQIAAPPTASGDPVSFTEQVGIVNSFRPDPNILTDLPPNKGYVSSTCKLVAKSGCMFRRMEPASFWQGILGFSPNLIVTDEELGLSNEGVLNPIILPKDINRFTYERFNNVTTRSLLSTAMNFTTSSVFPNIEESYITNMYYPNPDTSPVNLAYSSVLDSWYSTEMTYNFIINVINTSNTGGTDPVSPIPPQWNESWYQALDQTVTIPAIKAPTLVSDLYGHYLIEIEGYQSSLLNEQQKYGIKAIVSSYYNNIGSFTSLPFNDMAFLYQHVGESITLNNFRVRILNGKMEEVAGLGDNSCVYLQINKAISQVEVQQV